MELNHSIRIFNGATAIVTGAASGIGRALSKELAKRGAEVVLFDLQLELAEEAASEINQSGGKAKTINVDVSDYPAMERHVRETVNRTGRLDYIFNNAGIAIAGAANDYGIEHWNQIIDVNLRGVVNGVQAAYKIMIGQGFGHIVNTASMAGLMASPGMVGYTTTKYGVVGLSIALRGEAAHMGIRVSVICPGVIRTPILEGGGKYGKMLINIPLDKQRQIWEKLRPMPPDIFAAKVLDLVARNRAIIIVPSRWRIYWWINRLSPSLGMFLGQKSFQKMLRELDLVKKKNSHEASIG